MIQALLLVALTFQQPHVRPGIDVLMSDSVRLIAHKRIGLITNQSGIDAHGTSTIDRLFAFSNTRHPTPNTRLVALFAPEHGIRGTGRPGDVVNDATDSATGLPIYSLYGANRAPTPLQMKRLDVIVVDLQDVGTRTWTYVSTMIASMRAAKAAGKRIIVLDRPNPIGCAMEGPVLDTALMSFIGPLPVPLRHGMTMGELARFANGELEIHSNLVVVPVQGWHRCEWFDETGLPWVRPSPNLPTLESVAWYPGMVLFEATNLSVGRGTDAPFRQVGAPWLLDSALAPWASRFGEYLTFTPHAPGDGKYADTLLGGIRLPAFQRDSAHPVAYALKLLAQIDGRFAGVLRIDSIGVAKRLGVRLSQYGPDDIDAFRRRVAPYLLYH